MSDSKLKSKKGMFKKEVFTSSSSSTCSWSSDEENDTTTLKAIKDYLSNRTELAHQLFKSVKIGKIRMMLPQMLKKIDMVELEELCGSELSGMSKSRILSILNGTPMINSSDTSDSDDSGPSLEIISDTEAWISDTEQQNYSSYSRDKSKNNKKLKLQTNHNGSTSLSSKSRKTSASTRHDNHPIKIKKEKEKDQVKNQEGESLLDLLELEMRARAIKALIRKEEDIVSTMECEQKNLSSTQNIDTPATTVHNTLLHESIGIVESLSCKTEENQVKKSTLKSVNMDEDQDVVMLVNPTPTINLLSTDSESDDSNKDTNIQVTHKQSNNESENLSIDTKYETTDEPPDQTIMDVLNVNNTNSNSEKMSIPSDKKFDSNGSPSANVKVKQDLDENNKIPIKNLDLLEMNKDRESSEITIENLKTLVPTSENKMIDEEIIDLDAYPDDMDDMENYEHMSIRNEKSTDKINTTNNLSDKSEKTTMNSEETWATRYYQTDNVQNVIKESKIQSEIRKRLRERQKLSKLSTSSKNIHISNVDNKNKAEQPNDKLKLMGSVQEYLALEGAISVGRATDSLQQTDKPSNLDDNIR